MGSIDAAVDAGSRVGTDMVRNAGKGEKEERVWRAADGGLGLSLLLTGLNEREEGKREAFS